MNFEKDIHAGLQGRAFQFRRLGVGDSRQDDQDTIRPQRPGLHYLIGIIQKILAQNRQGGRIPRN